MDENLGQKIAILVGGALFKWLIVRWVVRRMLKDF